jgi:hypothetical protein
MGAGSACSSLYNCNVNLKTCGGNKKQGLAVQVGGSMDFNYRAIKIKAIGNNRDVVFTMNQLGGVSSSSFGSSSHSYAIGNGVAYKKPFLCYPYCNSTGLQTSALPLAIPTLIETDPFIIPQLDIFQYSNYDGITHCYTNSTNFKKLQFDTITINDIPLNTYFSGLSITPDELLNKLYVALLPEDMYTGTGNLFIDRVDGSLYSTPNENGFTYGKSLCSQLYIAMLTNYPEQVNTCPSRQSVLQSGDVFSLPVTFLDRNVTFILNIKIE